MHSDISLPNHRNEESHIQMSELPIPQCASDAYQYISRIIENALEQTEQILLKLKTQNDDDTITNVKNKRVKLSEQSVTKKKPSEVHKKNSVLSSNKLGFNVEQILQPDGNGTETLPVSVKQYPRKTNNESQKIANLLHFPIDDEERNLRFTDRIFISLDQKSIMLMREYDSSPNHEQQRSKLNNWYQQQAKEMDQYLQQVKKIGTHHLPTIKNAQPRQFQYRQLQQQTEMIQQQPHKRIQKHKKRHFPRNALNAQVEFKSMSKENDYNGENTVEPTEEKVSEKLQKAKSQKERRKSDRKLKLHREELSESSNNLQVNDQTISSEKTDSVKRTTSDTSLQRRKIRRKSIHKKTASSLEHELAATPSSTSKEEETSGQYEGSDEIRQTGKHKKGRKKKKQQSKEQHFVTGPTLKHSHSTIIDPMGHRKLCIISFTI